MIRGPKHDGDYPDRDLDCQMNLEDALNAIIEEGQQVGWSKVESMNAIEELIVNFRKAYEEDPDPSGD